MSIFNRHDQKKSKNSAELFNVIDPHSLAKETAALLAGNPDKLYLYFSDTLSRGHLKEYKPLTMNIGNPHKFYPINPNSPSHFETITTKQLLTNFTGYEPKS